MVSKQWMFVDWLRDGGCKIQNVNTGLYLGYDSKLSFCNDTAVVEVPLGEALTFNVWRMHPCIQNVFV